MAPVTRWCIESGVKPPHSIGVSPSRDGLSCRMVRDRGPTSDDESRALSCVPLSRDAPQAIRMPRSHEHGSGAIPDDVPGFHEAQVEAHEAQVDLSTVGKTVLRSCADAPKRAQELLTASGYSSRTGNFKRSLDRLLALRLIEMTIPDKPRSSKQRYRLTQKGRKLLAQIQGTDE